MFFLIEPDGTCPEGEGSEGLVGPCEITPNDIEIHEHHAEYAQEQRQGDDKTSWDRALVPFEEIRHDQTCTTQGCVTARDRSCYNADDGEYAANRAEP